MGPQLYWRRQTHSKLKNNNNGWLCLPLSLLPMPQFRDLSPSQAINGLPHSLTSWSSLSQPLVLNLDTHWNHLRSDQNSSAWVSLPGKSAFLVCRLGIGSFKAFLAILIHSHVWAPLFKSNRFYQGWNTIHSPAFRSLMASHYQYKSNPYRNLQSLSMSPTYSSSWTSRPAPQLSARLRLFPQRTLPMHKRLLQIRHQCQSDYLLQINFQEPI